MFAWSHPINLKTLKLLTAAIINKCTKILVKGQLIKKDCDSKYLLPRDIFSLQFTVFNRREVFFSEHSVSLFRKSSCGHPVINGYCIYFKRAFAAMNYVYTIYLTDISIYDVLLFQRSTCCHIFEWYRHFFRRPLALI